MSRTSHSVARRKRVKKILKLAKGYWGERRKRYKRAKETVKRALVYAYRDRKVRKRNFRRLWILRINAKAREFGINYRDFISGLRKSNIELSRDILAQLAIEEPETFERLTEVAKGALSKKDNS
ncbi:MAG TPA: 50S ribosomal protein L20 [Candidatus Omnitrophica bacterium]|nr:50S ribosomal protein L20 [Candidatus Omnitrophota bacterium]